MLRRPDSAESSPNPTRPKLSPRAAALLRAWRLPEPRWRAFLTTAHQHPLPAPDRLAAGQRAALAVQLRAITDVLRYLARYDPG